MQKKTTYCFLLIALMVMTGCEDMFFREIDFERDTEPEMLVLTGNFMVNQVPQVQVSHSFFLDRTDKRADDWVTDAEVSLSVNGTAYTLSYDSVIEAYTNPTLPRLQALDTIEVTAIHPSYATAIARQVMPAQINSTVVSYEIRPNHCVAFQLDLDTYEGNADDVIAIRAQAEVEVKQTRSYGNGETWTTTQTLQYKTLFSTDILFSEAENLSTEGYYGVNDYNYLYFPSSALNKPRRVSLFLDHYWFGMDEYDSFCANNTWLRLSAGAQFLAGTGREFHGDYDGEPARDVRQPGTSTSLYERGRRFRACSRVLHTSSFVSFLIKTCNNWRIMCKNT